MDDKTLAIIGNMGSGKNIIYEFMKMRFRKLKYFERRLENVELSANFSSEVFLLMKFFEELQKTSIYGYFLIKGHPIILKDVIIPVLESHEKIDKNEVLIFNKIYSILDLKEPKYFIYTKMNINKCYENILNDGTTINYDILKDIENSLKIWISKRGENVLTIDMDIFSDLEGNEKLQKTVMNILLLRYSFLEMI